MDARQLRDARLRAEATDLQRRLRLNGYIIGDVLDLDAMPPAHREWQARLWYIGYALHNPAMPENPGAASGSPLVCSDDSCDLVHCRKCGCHTVGNTLAGGMCQGCADCEDEALRLRLRQMPSWDNHCQ